MVRRRIVDVAHAGDEMGGEPVEADAGVAVVGEFVAVLGADVGPGVGGCEGVGCWESGVSFIDFVWVLALELGWLAYPIIESGEVLFGWTSCGVEELGCVVDCEEVKA